MRFTELLREINQTWPEASRRWRILAVRYWLGIDSADSLWGRIQTEVFLTDRLTQNEVELIIKWR